MHRCVSKVSTIRGKKDTSASREPNFNPYLRERKEKSRKGKKKEKKARFDDTIVNQSWRVRARRNRGAYWSTSITYLTSPRQVGDSFSKYKQQR